MNQENYCSLNVAQKLVGAGIVLETDFVWRLGADGWKLRNKDWVTNMMSNTYESYPAPSFAEIWRELPESITKGGTIQYLEMGKTGSKTYAVYDFADEYVLFDNPTDALIDLLVWLKGEGK